MPSAEVAALLQHSGRLDNEGGGLERVAPKTGGFLEFAQRTCQHAGLVEGDVEIIFGAFSNNSVTRQTILV